VVRRAAPGRIMDSRPKELFRITSKTLQAVGVGEAIMDRHTPTRPIPTHRIPTRHRMPRVTGTVEVGSLASPTSLACRVKSPTYSAVLGSEKGKVLDLHLPNLALMPRHMRLQNHHMMIRRVVLFYRNHVSTNLRPTHHPTRRDSRSHLGEAINLPMINLRDNLVMETPGVSSAAVLGTAGHRSPNHKRMNRTRIRGRTIGNSGSQASPSRTSRVLRNSLALSGSLDSDDDRSG